MHMVDALVAPTVSAAMFTCSGIAAGISIKCDKKDDDIKKIPIRGVMGAFIFAAQMVNFTIPGTGSSGHLCGGMLVSALLGPYAGFLTMIGVLLVQCLLFADGGILALGCNIWNMAFYGCYIGSMLIWKPIMKRGVNKRKIVLASVIGSALTLQLGALSVAIETKASGIMELPFGTFVAAMQPIHLVIGIIEGLITAAVLCFVYEARPEFLWQYNEKSDGRLTKKNTVLILFAGSLLVGGLLSLLASQNPDGLEWAIQNVAGNSEISNSGYIYLISEKIQKFTSLMSDYSLPNVGKETGTTISGIAGTLIVLLIVSFVCCLYRFFYKRRISYGKN